MLDNSIPTEICDQSYVLSIFIKELNSTQILRVSPSTPISSIAIDLINKINLKYDWTEFWFWYPLKNIWLLPKSAAFSQFKIPSQSKINFVRRFNVINIQLPDLQIRALLLDFSKTVFQTNQIICKKFGIRHSEELSLKWRLLNQTNPDSTNPIPNRRRKSKSVSQQSLQSPINSNLRPIKPRKSRRTFTRFFPQKSPSQIDFSTSTYTPSPGGLASPCSFFSIIENPDGNSFYFESFENSKLSKSPKKSFDEAVKDNDIFICRNYKERGNLQFHWMKSNSTMMEQAIGDLNNVLLLLRYKYHNYYYFNKKYDEIRINQIFHQACWSVLSGETDCSADEAYVLGGILYHVEKSLINDENESENNRNSGRNIDEEIDSMIDQLHLELLGRCEEEVDNTVVEISGKISVIRIPKTIFMRYEKYSATLTVNGINLFKISKKKIQPELLMIIPIKGMEIRLHVKLIDEKVFKIEIIMLKDNFYEINKSKQLIEKFKLKFYDQSDFIKWATALRLLSKSIDFSLLTNFQYEYQVVKNIVEMKCPGINLKLPPVTKEEESINLNDLIGSKFNKSFKRKEIIQKIVYFAKSFKHYNTTEAKIAYIKCWLTLNNSGLSYFQVNVNKHSEVELIGLGYDRVLLMDLYLGNVKQSFDMTNIVSWNTNWELGFTMLEFKDDKWSIKFKTSDDCQIFHEYLGGYLFIMMRNSEKYANLNEKCFRNLTSRTI